MSVRYAGKMLVAIMVISGAAGTACFFYLVMGGNSMPAPRFVLTGSDNLFLRVAFSPDGALVAAGQQGGTVTLWEAVSAKEAFTYSEPRDSIQALAFSPDGQTLAWGGWQYTVTLFDIKTKVVKARLPGHEVSVSAIAFNPNSASLLATATQGGAVRIWNTESKEVRVIFQAERYKASRYQNPVEAIAFDPSGQTLAIGSRRIVHFLDLMKGGKIRASAEISHRDITNLCFSPDGKILAGGGAKVILWENATGKELASIPILPDSLAFSPDGKMLAIGRMMGEHAPSYIKIWDLDEQKEISSIVSHHRPLSQLAWSPDGKTLATASCDKTVKLWDIGDILKKARK